MRRAFSTVSRVRQNVSLFTVPINFGQPLTGPDKAPSLLINGGLLNILDKQGWDVKRFPKIDADGFVHPKDELTKTAEAAAKNCAEVGFTCERAYKEILPQAKTMILY